MPRRWCSGDGGNIKEFVCSSLIMVTLPVMTISQFGACVRRLLSDFFGAFVRRHPAGRAGLLALCGKRLFSGEDRVSRVPVQNCRPHRPVLLFRFAPASCAWRGRIAWSSAPVSKTGRVHALEGSNPSLSATQRKAPASAPELFNFAALCRAIRSHLRSARKADRDRRHPRAHRLRGVRPLYRAGRRR